MEMIYKTLLEIKLLHEFFLINEDGTSLLDEPDPAKRREQLDQSFSNDRETINRDLSFEFPDNLKSLYEKHGLKVLPSFSGCKVLARVSRETLPNKSIVFKPYFTLPDSLEIFINIVRKNNLPNIYSNRLFSSTVPATFLFSNENIPDARVFPFLVNNVPSYVAGLGYEQGALALDNTGKLQEIYYDKDGVQTLIEVKRVVKNFANENDRMLLPLKFNLRVIHDLPVNHIDIVLKDQSGTEIKKITIDQADPINNLRLDFSDKKNLLQLSGNLSMPIAIFSLAITGNNGYAETRNVVFDDLIYSSGNWGVIHIKPKVTNSAFNLIAPDGFIIKRSDHAGVWTEAPTVEIPVKSRLGHYRYLNNKGKRLDLNTPLDTFLSNENGVLISLMPVSLAHYYSQIPDGGSTTTRYLPNPVSLEMKRDEKQRIFFDVYVPESEMFPIIP